MCLAKRQTQAGSAGHVPVFLDPIKSLEHFEPILFVQPDARVVHFELHFVVGRHGCGASRGRLRACI